MHLVCGGPYGEGEAFSEGAVMEYLPRLAGRGIIVGEARLLRGWDGHVTSREHDPDLYVPPVRPYEVGVVSALYRDQLPCGHCDVMQLFDTPRVRTRGGRTRSRDVLIIGFCYKRGTVLCTNSH